LPLRMRWLLFPQLFLALSAKRIQYNLWKCRSIRGTDRPESS
jgi:hypothetical protein